MDHSLIRPLGQSFRSSARRVAQIPSQFTRYNSTVSQSAAPNLSWPDYLAIRRGKRKWETAVTIPCTILGFAGGVLYFGTLETDATKPIFVCPLCLSTVVYALKDVQGIDPLIFYGLCTMGCVGAGALIGPTIGGALWRITHRRTMNLIDARDREFYQRIQKNRADPTAQSAMNPVPDFYGEKIGSLHQYRQWLRDQAKYRRKSQLPEE